MKKFFSVFAVFLIMGCGLFWTPGFPVAWAEQDASYKIEAGDVLEVTVADQPDLSATGTVLADGTLSLPLVGTLQVEKLTLDQIREKLTEIYNKRFVAQPTVSVTLRQSRANQFFIYGEIAQPGNYPFREGLTVLRAIAIGRGLTRFADKDSVKIFRAVNGQKQVIEVNIKKAERGSASEDLTILPEDVIVVPENRF